MKIHVLLSPLNVDDLYFTGKTVVVIDVLRATTTITTALANGAREVVPVGTIEFAMKVSGNAFGGQTILGGERNTKKIEGFTFGNSPLEYSREAIESKSVILFTTNGTKAIVKAKFSENLLIGCLNNLTALCDHLQSLKKDVIFLCAGSSGMFCIEDTVCAGKYIEELQSRNIEIELNDSAKASLTLCKTYENDFYKMLSESEHGNLLIENGFKEDIDYVSKVGNINAVPFYDSGAIKKLVNSSETNDKSTKN